MNITQSFRNCMKLLCWRLRLHKFEINNEVRVALKDICEITCIAMHNDVGDHLEPFKNINYKMNRILHKLSDLAALGGIQTVKYVSVFSGVEQPTPVEICIKTLSHDLAQSALAAIALSKMAEQPIYLRFSEETYIFLPIDELDKTQLPMRRHHPVNSALDM